MHYGFVHEGEKCCCNYVIDTFGKTLKYILICQIMACYKCDFSAPTRKTFRRHNGFFHECVKCYTIFKKNQLTHLVRHKVYLKLSDKLVIVVKKSQNSVKAAIAFVCTTCKRQLFALL